MKARSTDASRTSEIGPRDTGTRCRPVRPRLLRGQAATDPSPGLGSVHVGRYAFLVEEPIDGAPIILA